VFFSEAKYGNQDRKEQYLEPNYVRRVFREYAEEAGLDETYDMSEENRERTPRCLHRLTTHSLRHYAITKFSRGTTAMWCLPLGSQDTEI
jgi:hypothetical protein